jgi:hypothetical protein
LGRECVFIALAVENLDSRFLRGRGQRAVLRNSLGAQQLAGILPRSRKIRVCWRRPLSRRTGLLSLGPWQCWLIIALTRPVKCAISLSQVLTLPPPSHCRRK